MMKERKKTSTRISLKELRKTQRWLKLIQRAPLIKKPELLDDILQGFIKGSRLNSPPACKPYGLEAERMYGHCHSLKALIRL
jgi:hypothetical protein